MEQSRILFPDKDGKWHRVISAGMEIRGGLPNLYIFFTKNFTTVSAETAASVKDLISQDSSTRQTPVMFSEVHLRYPPDGNAHLQFKDENGNVMKGGVPPYYSKHEPLTELTPAKRIFGIVPSNIRGYPIYDEPPRESDWRLQYSIIPDFFIEQPILLSFWMGIGLENELLEKAAAIRMFEMKETLRHVQVFSGQDSKFQLFMAVSRPRELLEPPTTMRLFLYPSEAVAQLSRINQSDK